MIGLKDKWENQEPGIKEDDTKDEEEKEEPIKEVDQKEYLNEFLTGIKNDLVISETIEKKESFKVIEEAEKNIKHFDLKKELKRLENLQGDLPCRSRTREKIEKSKKFQKNISEIKINKDLKIDHNLVLNIFD